MDGKDLLEGFRYIDPTYIREAKSASFPSGPRRGALRKALPAIVLWALALGLGAVVYLRCLRGS